MYNYNKSNITNSRNLRKNLTPWERKLWFELFKNFPYKIYRQRTVGQFILDFYCPKTKIAIELDGSQHYLVENISSDSSRTKELNKLGIKVLRYSNADIDKNFEKVCEDIYRNMQIIK